MRRLPIVLHVVYKNDWSSAFLPGCAGVHLPTMTPRVKPPHTLVSVLHWLWYCRATALSALANLTLLLGKNTLPFPAFGNLNFVSPPHRRAYTSIPKSCPNIRFPHQQDFFPIRSVTKSSMARFSHENLVEKFKIFVQDFIPIRTALRALTTSPKMLGLEGSKISWERKTFFTTSPNISSGNFGSNSPSRGDFEAQNFLETRGNFTRKCLDHLIIELKSAPFPSTG